MNLRTHSKTRLRLEELENRLVPARLTPIEPPGLDGILPGPALVHTAESAAVHAHARPFHLVESGQATFNPDGSISGIASGRATHLGAFTLNDTSTITGSEIIDGELIVHIASTEDAVLVAANGDRLFASFTGTLNFTTGEGDLTFEWTGGDGRFTDATGTTLWHINVNLADLTYTAVADGVINY